jgi:hemerythrin
MALLEWRDDFCTGIDGVDHEHQALVKQINAVYSMIGNPTDKEQVIDSLGDIYGSISAHFALEERMMKRNDYVEYHEHQNDHERLLDEIREISDEFESTAQLDDAHLKRRLADWFQQHFKTFDSRLHRMSEMREHETVGPITLKRLIQNARNRFITRPRG